MMKLESSSLVRGDGGDWISIGDLFSEESSFDGNEQTKAELERRAEAYNPKDYWDIQAWNLQCLAAAAATKLANRGMKRKRDDSEEPDSQTMETPAKIVSSSDFTTARPFNPYEGDETAKQLEKSLDNFLVRLQPSVTRNLLGHWIRIADPTSGYRPLNADIANFKRAATDHMESYLSTKATLERDEYLNATPATITRKLKPGRDELERTILDQAKRHGVTKGKWLLFPSSNKVDQTWATIARKTLEGKLGCAAKVAINGEDDSRNDQKLLCIYTKDFSDVADIKRILRELHESKLVIDQRKTARDGTIYYKCDAYTHLDISYGNEFKLKASMYNSKDLFAEMKSRGEL